MSSVKHASQVKKLRIGIYSGTFDPVHSGHIAFALQALTASKLNEIYLIPERRPRGKFQVTHYAHRVAMIRRATRPYGQLKVLELEDKTFSVTHTLPRIEKRFAGAQLVYLCGSDVLRHMERWAQLTHFFDLVELCVGMRHKERIEDITDVMRSLPAHPKAYRIIESYASTITSSQIRDALRARRGVHGLLVSVREYAAREWLYI